jgi:predicted permease
MIEVWKHETRMALRRLRRRPSFTLLAVAVLAIGIGGVTAVGSLAWSVLRPLDFPEPDRLVSLWERHGDTRRNASPANYLDWRRLAGGFEGLAAHRATGASVTVDGVATRERVADVSGNFFAVLGVEPTVGRGFDPTFDVAFADREIVIAAGAARDRFGAAEASLGRNVRIGDASYLVVGVAPAGLAFPEPGLFGWVRAPAEAPPALGFRGDLTALRDAWYFDVVGRMAEGVTLDRARAELATVARRLEELHPESNEDATVEIVPLLDQTVAGFGTIVAVLGLAVALLLLAAIANVVSLASVRAREMRPDAAVRVSLGAVPSDLVRGHVAEGWLLGAAGAVLGLVLADGGLRATAGRFGSVIPRVGEVGLSSGLVAAGLVGGIVAGSVVAVAAFVGTRPDRSVRSRLSPHAGGRLVLGAQVTSAVVVLSCAATVALSLQRLAAVDPGFEPDGLTTLRVALPDAASRSYDERLAEYARVADALRALPGVARVGIGSSDPLRTGPSAGVRFEGRDPDDIVDTGWQPAGPDFFAALGVPVLSGRGIEPTDRAGSLEVAVVNETFVREAFGSDDPLGRRVSIGLDGHDRPLTIVGVVGDTKTRGPAADPAPMMYRPLAQTDRFTAGSVFLAVRSRAGGVAPAGAVARAAAPGMPVYDEATGGELLRSFRTTQAMLFTIVGVFGLTALALGLVGVYGMGAESVRSRRREIGVRLALGATGGGILRLVVLEGARAAAFGVVPGLALAWAATALLESRLFETGLADVYVAPSVTVGVLLLAAGVLVVPARRASRTSPAESTRAT